MKVKTVFGENLKFYRKEKHLSQEQLSEKLDISVKHLSAIERGLTFISAELLEKLSNSLEIPVFFFFVKDKEFSIQEFDKRVVYNDIMLNTIDEIIKKNLLKAIEDIKSDIRQNNQR